MSLGLCYDWLMKSFFNLAVIFLISLLVTPAAQAATPYGNRSSDIPTEVYLPPAVFVPTVSLDTPKTAAGTTLHGEFTVLNREERFIGDLTYRIQLLGRLEGTDEVVADTAPEYDQAKSSAAFSLAPQERTVVPFTYVVPQVPSGSYRLRIQLTTKEFRDLGWRDAELTVEGSALPFAVLTANSLSVAEYPDQTLSPMSGPNVNQGGAFSLLATVKNVSDTEATFTPIVVISQPNNPEAGPVTVKGENLTLTGGEEKAVSLPLTALTAPAIYRGELMLLAGDDQHRASTIASYQWIVRGVAGHIVSASLDQSTFQAGNIAVATITYSGSADAETTFKGVVTVQLEDHEGVIASASSPSDVELTDALQTARAELKLDRTPSSDVQLVVKLSDTRGNLLDDYAVTFPLEQLTTKASAFSRQQMLIVAAILAVALVVCVIIVIRRRQRPSTGSGPMAPLTTMAAILLVLGGAIQLAWAAGNGNGINVLNPSIVQPGGHWTAVAGRPSIELFINDPIHNMPSGTYDRSKVPLSYRVQWAVCGNDWAYARVVTSYLNTDIAYTGFQPPAGSAWVQVSNKLWGEAFGCAGSCSYITARNFTAPNGINMSQLPANAAQATLRILALRGKDSQSIPQWNEGPSAYTNFGGFFGEHAVNLWLNFRDIVASTTPTPSSSPSVSPTPTTLSGADVSVTISAPTTVEKGSLLNYSVTVKNIGSDLAAQVKAVVPIPTGLAFHEASSSSACSNVGTNVECSLGTLNSGQLTPLAVVLTVGETATCNANISTIATVSTASTDTDTANNVATSNETKVTCGECRDAADNDADTKIDSDDPACHENYDINQPYNLNRPSEKDTQCIDGQDNDGDDLIDANDPGCHVGNDISKEYVPADNTESGAAPFDPGGFKVVE